MNRLKNYIVPAWYNIRHNLSFALFYVLGTAFSFVFISITLQMLYSFIGDVPPVDKGNRIVGIGEFYDTRGYALGGIEADETDLFMESVKGVEAYARSDEEWGDIFAGDAMVSQCVNFVNADYWKVFRFDFIEGRPFTHEEYENREPVAVVNRTMAEALFKGGKVVGQKLEFQKVFYTITGVVDNISFFTTSIGEGFWLSDRFNTFSPSGNNFYYLLILFPEGYSMTGAKSEVARAVRAYYDGKGRTVDISPDKVRTQREKIVKRMIGLDILTYGIPVVVLLLLLIPAINILTLSLSNSRRRAEEVAIRRALGASRPVLFSYIVAENFMLVIVGVLIGLLLFFPVVHVIERVCFEDTIMWKVSFLTHLDFAVIVGGVLPLSILFTLFVSVLPAYVALRGSMAEVLKGGSR